MATLVQRIISFIDALRGRIDNDITPRLLPSGGAKNEILRKNTSGNYDVFWSSDKASEGVIHEFIVTQIDGAQSATLAGVAQGNVLVFIRGVAQSPAHVNLNITASTTEVTFSNELDFHIDDTVMIYYIRLKEL
jgi:hypothetical protein